MGNSYDLILIGAGSSGLGAAKVFLQCQPHLKFIIIDTNSSIGGVWAEENTYPSLKTNNLRGTIDFSDFPMGDEFGVKTGEHVPGLIMHKYLTAYAQKWNMMEHFMLGTEVKVIEKADGINETGWTLTTERRGRSDSGSSTNSGTEASGSSILQLEDKEDGEQGNMHQHTSPTTILHTKKLIIATGIASQPHVPQFLGSHHFDAPIIHSSRFGRQQGRILNEKIKAIAVLGGGKSAYDAVHLAASQGVKVEWIIRRSGKGPTWIMPPYTNIGPFKVWRETFLTRRILGLFSPSVNNNAGGFGWLKKLVHGTKFGNAFARKFWQGMHDATLVECGYAKHPTTKLLEPEAGSFWYGATAGILTYSDDFYSHVHDGTVRVHREDIAQCRHR
jgi:cation diffusion facilitator CzcD-associated flavoprotein CzcO